MYKELLVNGALAELRIGSIQPIQERVEQWLRNNAIPEYYVISLTEVILERYQKEQSRF